MIRQIVVVASFALVCTFAFKFEDIPEDYRDLVPKEAKEFMTGLSEPEKAVLKEMHQNVGQYKTEEEFLAALKKKSPELAGKAERFHAMINKKVAALGPEAQGFAKQMLDSARQVRAQYFAGNKPSRAELKKAAMGVITKYNALSAAGKEDFQKQFPILSKVFTNEKLLKRLQN
ncbi:nematode fatty acid retinoid binding protein [Ancylostoma ceylanicum]|uniref:Fatty-acid and retinol-binding protein 1 n=2 Tax=Ancylostoma ceylanicum TaxID=53326 RepID=A0A0D6MB46_9BILA|nr:nematode fatty acid retinoid binding protein [Ancylostoma ceylanicum]EYC30421.1 hypothetical protein Y032_0005g2646 [Ancylostoma ceylanicum]